MNRNSEFGLEGPMCVYVEEKRAEWNVGQSIHFSKFQNSLRNFFNLNLIRIINFLRFEKITISIFLGSVPLYLPLPYILPQGVYIYISWLAVSLNSNHVYAS